MKRLKKKTAGRLVRSVVYTVPQRTDQPQSRSARQRISSAAQARLNLKNSRNDLEMVLACNFGDGDIWLTLTYDNEHLPQDRREANKTLKKFLGKLRNVRKKRGNDLKYVYCTQQILDDGTQRLHHHIVLNATGAADFDDLRSLWTEGRNIKIDHLNGDDDITDKATYMCHEPLEHGKPKRGEKTWISSQKLKRPVEECIDVPDDVYLQAPVGSTAVENDSFRNEYGEFIFIKYWLPKEDQTYGPKYYPRGRY